MINQATRLQDAQDLTHRHVDIDVDISDCTQDEREAGHHGSDEYEGSGFAESRPATLSKCSTARGWTKRTAQRSNAPRPTP